MIELAENIDERRGLPSASGMERLALCPGSWLAEHSAPEESESEWAAEGTKLHAVLAGEIPDDDLTDDQQWVVDRCHQIVQMLIEASAIDCTFVEREKRLWSTSRIYSGKPDVVYYDGAGNVLVIDYKTGRGEVAPAERNWQMRALAVLSADAYGHENFSDLKSVFVALVHPRYQGADGQPFTLCRYEPDDILTARVEIDSILAAVLDSNAPRFAGPSQCRYCRAKAMCPEAQETVSTVAAIGGFSWDGSLPVLTPEKVAELLPLAALADKVSDAIRARAEEMIESGIEVPGWTLKPGATRRTIADPQAAYDRLSEVLTPEQFTSACTVALGKLQTVYKDATGLKGKAAKEALAERLEGVIEEKSAAPSLAPVTEVVEALAA